MDTIGYHQLVQKLEWIKQNISTLQDKQNKRKFYRVSSTDSKVRMNNTIPFFSVRDRDKQNIWSLKGFICLFKS